MPESTSIRPTFDRDMPLTPETTSANLPEAAAFPQHVHPAANNSRKRPRTSSPGLISDTFRVIATPLGSAGRCDVIASRPIDPSPIPYINMQYDLRGGLDTPTYEIEARCDVLDDYKESAFRRHWSVGSARQEDSTAYPNPGMQLGGPRNGRILLSSSANGNVEKTLSWGSLVVGLVGGVAGKMWEFCKTSAFRGFYAGGGEGYEMKHTEDRSTDISESNIWEDMESPAPQIDRNREMSPMPGMWPEPDYLDYKGEISSYRPAKRNRTGAGPDWVIVDMVGRGNVPTSSPASSGGSLLTTSATQSRKASRPAFRRSTTSTTSFGSPSALNNQRRIVRAPLRTASKPNFGTPSKKSIKGASPVSAEAQRYAERIRREDRQTEASIRRLNDRLSAMIKQGREALGTEVDIVDDMLEDEGFFQ